MNTTSFIYVHTSQFAKKETLQMKSQVINFPKFGIFNNQLLEDKPFNGNKDSWFYEG